MSQTLQFSVALCTYNGAQFLREQLSSVLAQRRRPDESILCDDGSTDDSVALARSLLEASEVPFSIRVNSEQLGITRNFEQALAACSGSHIVLADQDDRWSPDYLARAEAALAVADERPRLLYTDPVLIDESGRELGQRFSERAGIRRGETAHWKTLALRNFAPGCCTIMDARLRDLALPIPDQAILHDWWINLVGSLAGVVEALPGDNVYYRLHNSNAMGVNSATDVVGHLRKRSADSIAMENFKATFDQCRAAAYRLSDQVVPAGEWQRYLEVLALTPWQRVTRVRALGMDPASVRRRLQLWYVLVRLGRAPTLEGAHTYT